MGYNDYWSSFLLPPLFRVKGSSKQRMHGSKPPVARTGQHPWLRSGYKILPTRIGYGSNTSCASRVSVRITTTVLKMCSSQALFLSNWTLGAMYKHHLKASCSNTLPRVLLRTYDSEANSGQPTTIPGCFTSRSQILNRLSRQAFSKYHLRGVSEQWSFLSTRTGTWPSTPAKASSTYLATHLPTSIGNYNGKNKAAFDDEWPICVGCWGGQNYDSHDPSTHSP